MNKMDFSIVRLTVNSVLGGRVEMKLEQTVLRWFSSWIGPSELLSSVLITHLDRVVVSAHFDICKIAFMLEIHFERFGSQSIFGHNVDGRLFYPSCANAGPVIPKLRVVSGACGGPDVKNDSDEKKNFHFENIIFKQLRFKFTTFINQTKQQK